MLKKVVFAFAVASLLSAACQKDVLSENTPVSMIETRVSFTTAGTPASLDTKAQFGTKTGDTYPVLWDEGDQVSLTVTSTSGTTDPVWVSISPSPDGKLMTFDATLSLPASGSYTITATAPAELADVPALQKPGSGTPDPSAILVKAEASLSTLPSEAVSLEFAHVCAYGKLTLKNLPTTKAIQSIELGGDAIGPITLQTTSAQNVFFATKPVDVGGKTLKVKVVTAGGAYEASTTFPLGKAFQAGKVASFSVDMAGATAVTPKSVSILAIGNSFSWDAMEYLYGILKAAGVETVVLGNLYIGGCTLQTHAGHFANNAAEYQYRKNTSGTWTSTNSFKPLSALEEREWDYITMQQASGSSGIASTYDPYLAQLISIVKEKRPNAKLLWHMTWAYQQNSTHSEFPKYNSDQMTMYNAIVSAVQTQVLPTGQFLDVIPCGTAVQNLRTSFIGDTITRDGYHMSYDKGRFVTGLMWARLLTGSSIVGNTYRPSGYSYTDEVMAALWESVENAFRTPLAVTQSQYAPKPYVLPDELVTLFRNAGYDPGQYNALPLTIEQKAYYNSTGGSTLTCAANGSTASNLVQFAATQIFGKGQIPNGSVIVLKNGFQYRPEGWKTLSTKNASSARPGNVTTSIVTVDDSWWAAWNFRAFNLAKSGNPPLTDAEQDELLTCFAIFVPKK